MDRNFWSAFFDFVTWVVAFILPAVSNDVFQPVIDAFMYVSIYFVSTGFAVLAIILFWFGPFISWRVFGVILAAMIVIEILPNVILAVFAFIKKYVPIA